VQLHPANTVVESHGVISHKIQKKRVFIMNTPELQVQFRILSYNYCTNVHESSHTLESVISRIFPLTHTCMGHGTNSNASCLAHTCVMAHACRHPASSEFLVKTQYSVNTTSREASGPFFIKY